MGMVQSDDPAPPFQREKTAKKGFDFDPSAGRDYAQDAPDMNIEKARET